MEAREVGDQHQAHAEGHHGLAAHLVAEPAEKHIEDRRHARDADHQDVHVDGGQLEQPLKEELGVEVARIPDDALGHHDRKEGEEHDLERVPAHEAFHVDRLGRLAFGLHPLERRALLQGQTDPERDDQQPEGHQERHPPAPFPERLLAHQSAREEGHAQRRKQAERGGGLDPARVIAALRGGRMLGDVDHRPAVLAPQREALQDPAQHEEDGRDDSGAGADVCLKPGVVREQSDGDCRQAHHRDGDQEGAFAPLRIPHLAEDQGPERSHNEADRKGQKGEDERLGVRQAGVEVARDDRGQDREDEKVVPFEHGAGRRGGDHRPHPLGIDLGLDRRRRLRSGTVAHVASSEITGARLAR
jgi:hypothetical protein